MMAAVQQENAPADSGVATTRGDYWAMTLAAFLRMVKLVDFTDRLTQRLLTGIANLLQGRAYSGQGWMM